MKILVICQHYWPEPYPLTDLCEELAARGHTVDVVADVPNYPLGETYSGYERGQKRQEEHNGVTIYRTFTVPRKHNVIFRVLNYYSYSLSSAAFVRKLDDDYDVVFANQTSPVMMVRAAMKYKKMHNCKVVLYCMDLWPASLAAGGLKSGPAYQYYLKVSQHYYKQADRILITSRMFRDYLTAVIGYPDEKIFYLPQYAADNYLAVEHHPEKGMINLTFAGNIGTAQSLDTVLKAAQLVQKDETYGDKIRFNIVGDGSDLERLKELSGQLQLRNVVFHGRVSSAEVVDYYARADAMLLTLTRDEFISLTLPGKLQAYLAAGKPVLAAADGEISHVMSETGCGYCVPAEDHQGLAGIILKFAGQKDHETLSRNARSYYHENFEKHRVIAQLEQHLKEMSR